MPLSSVARTLLSVLVAASLTTGCRAGLGGQTDRPDLPTPERELDPDKLGNGALAELDNGLKIFVVPDPYTNLIEFDVRHQVGSRDDPENQAGMAHFVEHLMFMIPSGGKDEPESPPLFRDIPNHTLFFNAYTAADHTHYMHLGTGDELETFMKYTQLRLGYGCDDVPEQEFLRERDVVRNEHRWRGQGVEAEVWTQVLALAYPEGHPYRSQRFADIDAQVASITPQDACNFVKKWYTPSQSTLVVTGNVDPIEVLSLAKKYLGKLPKVTPPKRPQVPPAKFAKQNAEITAPVKKPSAMVLFQAPKRFTADFIASQAALETMFTAVAFFTGRNEGSVIKDWNFQFFGGPEAPLYGVSIETEKARDLDRGIDEVLDAISRGFSPELKGKDNRATYDSVRQRTRLQLLDTVANVTARAGAYADYLEEGNKPGMLGKDLFLLDELKPEYAQAIGRKVFAREKALVVKVVPDGTADKAKVDRASFDYKPKDEEKMSVPEDIDPAEAHKPLPIDDIATAEGQSLEYELDNGMKVVLVQSTQVPVMDVQVIVGAGLVDAPEHSEIARMAVDMFTVRFEEAAGMQFASEGVNLAQFFNLAGGIFNQFVAPTSTTYASRGLSIYLDFIIAGFADRVVNAAYQTGALDGWKLARKERLEKKSFLQQVERENAYNEALYGKGHPHVRAEIADPAALRDIRLKDLEDFRAKHFRAANSAVIVTGGFDMDLAVQYIERYFNDPVLRDRKNTWNEPAANAGRTAPPEPNPGSIRYLTEADKRKVQTDIRMGYPLREVYGDDHAALLVMAGMLNYMVGAVRQKLGASYGVYARVDSDRPGIQIGGSLDSARAGEGYAAIRAAIDEIRKEGPEFDRLFAYARRSTLHTMIGQQGDPEALAGQLAQAIRNGRSYDYFQELSRRVATLEPDDVRKLVDKVLIDDKSVTLVQGPQAGIDNVVEFNKITGATKLPDAVDPDDEKD